MSLEHTRLQFSIVLPVRNGGKHVKECVASILQQSYRDFNLLILENCSTDGTFEWLQSLDDDRIKIFPAGHLLMLEDNWSRISDIETNEFITVIGHDDLLDPHYLEVMSALIEKHPTATLYQSHFRFIDTNGDFLRHCLPMCEVQKVHEFVGKQFTRTRDSMGTGYMMRRKDFETVGGFSRYPNLVFGDYELWVKLTALGYLATAPSECFSYREHASASAATHVADYQRGLFQYLDYLDSEAKKCPQLRDVLRRYGPGYLGYMCENIIYRGLEIRRSSGVKTAIQTAAEFDSLRSRMIVNSRCIVSENSRIKMAILIDKWIVGRAAFKATLKAKYFLKYLLNSVY